MHGAAPHGLVMVHEPGRTKHHGWEDESHDHLQPLLPFIRLHEQVASLVAPCRVMAVALHTGRLAEPEARAEIARIGAETGLPTDDPVRFGGQRLFAAIRAQFETVPVTAG
jgi:uncharacterized NAD-dependent epimerase/dehydratase family protein